MSFPFGREFIPRSFEKYCRNISYRNFNWFVIWTVTTYCNLDCTYCYVGDRKDKKRNIEKGVDELIRAKPRFLGIHGGEPSLVPELPLALERFKKSSPNTFILTETNATYPEKIFDMLPFLNHIELSLDGLGDINKEVRGVDGDFIFRNFRKIHAETEKAGTSVSISTVLTTVNYRHFRNLVEKVADCAPGVEFAVFVMHPKENPLSVCHDEKIWKECKEIISGITEDHPNIKFKGDITVRPQCRCGAQFFIRHLDKMGNWFDCKPHMHLNIFRSKTKEARGIRGQIEILKQAFHLLDVLVLRKEKGLKCLAPCDWGEPLEPVFGYNSKMEESISKMIGKLDKKEIEEVRAFITKNINHNLPENWDSMFE
jgi:MoaA/NifB/PqqE/SkfB family radical SAM enzyme